MSDAPEVDPIDRAVDRLASLRERIEAGEPVDYAIYARLQALDAVEASRHFTKIAIRQAEQADAESHERNAKADGDLLQ